MNLIEYWAIALTLVLARVSMFIVTFPLFRNGQVPRLIKVALALALSTMWLTNLTLDDAATLPKTVDASWLAMSLAIARESLIGGMIGFAMGLFLLPAQIAGAYLGQEMGLNMAGITDPTSEAQSNALGNLFNSLAMMIFLVGNFHQLAIAALYSSFISMPIGEPLKLFHPEVFTQGFAEVHRLGLELAGPIGVCLLLTTVLLAVLMKISPQLNLFSVGTSLRLAVGLTASLIFLPDLIVMMRNIFAHSFSFVVRMGV